MALCSRRMKHAPDTGIGISVGMKVNSTQWDGSWKILKNPINETENYST